MEEEFEDPLGSELQQEALFEPLFDPGFSSAMVSTSFLPRSIAVFLVCGAGAHAAMVRDATKARAICTVMKIKVSHVNGCWPDFHALTKAKKHNIQNSN